MRPTRARRSNPRLARAHGARVDQRYNGTTPLHYVVNAGFVQTIGVLLEHGAETDALDDHGPGDEPSRAQALGAGWLPHQCFSAWSIAGRAASSMT